MRSQLRPALVSLILLTIVTGVIYPLIVTGIASLAFSERATGSVITLGDKAIGSELIAQPFNEPKYFWPRPSAANYNGSGGSGSNLAPTNPALAEAVKARLVALKSADPENASPVPVGLVAASGSGLDPHIGVAAANYQLTRVARARNLSVAQVARLIARHTESRTFGILGEARINVLKLNLDLDHPEHTAVGANDESGSDLTLYRARGFVPERR